MNRSAADAEADAKRDATATAEAPQPVAVRAGANHADGPPSAPTTATPTTEAPATPAPATAPPTSVISAAATVQPHSEHRRVLRARWLATMTGPMIEDGLLAMTAGRITFAGRRSDFDGPTAGIEDLGDALLLPGLVNAHAHLELSHAVRPAGHPAFIDWIFATMGQTPHDPDGRSAWHAAAARDGAAESLRHGVTCVADVTQNPAASRGALAGSPLRLRSDAECLGRGERRGRFEAMLHDVIKTAPTAPATAAATDRLCRGLSPHSPYTVDAAGYRAAVAAADAGAADSLLLSTHLAETPDERDFLRDGTGAFGRLYDRLGFDPGPVENQLIGVRSHSHPHFHLDSPSRAGGHNRLEIAADAGPVAFAAAVGLLDRRAILAHCNDLSDADIARLATGRASVVYCPRTHAYFGRPRHRLADLLAAGVNVALGTDSRASNPDLNLLDDLRWVAREHPEMDLLTLFSLVTTRAAAAVVGWGKAIGRLVPGALADCVVYPTTTGDALREIIANRAAPLRTVVAGRDVYRVDD